MAHFAKIENGKVTAVIVVNNSDCAGGDFPESEEAGQAFIASLGFEGEWLQTSYNRNFRGCFAGIGMDWNGSIFHGVGPFPSWILQDDGSYAPPVSMPTDDKKYYWDEDAVNWVEITP